MARHPHATPQLVESFLTPLTLHWAPAVLPDVSDAPDLTLGPFNVKYLLTPTHAYFFHEPSGTKIDIPDADLLMRQITHMFACTIGTAPEAWKPDDAH